MLAASLQASAAAKAALGPVAPVCSLEHALESSANGKVLAEYVWVTGNAALESRTIVLDLPAGQEIIPQDLPVAEVDGTHASMAPSEHCELFLRPRKVFPDPLRGGAHVLVLCDVFVPPPVGDLASSPGLQPHPANTRVACEEAMAAAAPHAPLLAAQQEYRVLDCGAAAAAAAAGCGGLGGCAAGGDGLPTGLAAQQAWAQHQYAGAVCLAQGARRVADLHMSACLKAGLAVSGAQQLAAPGCWSYRLGPLPGVDLGDQLWASRHMLRRVAERCGAAVSFEPGIPRRQGNSGGGLHAPPLAHTPHELAQPAPPPPAAGCLLEFSTAASRAPGQGISAVQQHIMSLQARHAGHAGAYAACAGSPASLLQLLVGPAAAQQQQQHQAGASGTPRSGSFTSNASSLSSWVSAVAAAAGASPLPFSCGVGDKRAAVMVPSSTLLNRCGPIVDRRPPAGMDPYLAVTLLAADALGLPLPAAAGLALVAAQAVQAAAQQAAAQHAACLGWASGSPGSLTRGGPPGLLVGGGRRPDQGAASSACFSGADGGGWGSDDCDADSGGNSEELLISELDRRDQRALRACSAWLAAAGGCGAGSERKAEEGCGETMSDGESPLCSGPLAGTLV